MRLAMLTRGQRDGMTAVDILSYAVTARLDGPEQEKNWDAAHRRGHYQFAALTAVVQSSASATCAKCGTAQAGIWLPIASGARRRTQRDLS
jgi:hypothetical protein